MTQTVYSNFKLKIRADKKYSILCFCFSLLLFLACFPNPLFGKTFTYKQIWSYEQIPEDSFLPLQLSTSGEVIQEFTTPNGIVTSFILIYDNILQNDPGKIYAKIVDSKENIYYEWKEDLVNLSINEGSSTYYLMDEIASPMAPNETYYIKTGLLNSDSNIALRAVNMTPDSKLVGDLSTVNLGKINGALYYILGYKVQSFPLLTITLLSLFVFLVSSIKLFWNNKELSLFTCFHHMVWLSPCIFYIVFEYINGYIYSIDWDFIILNMILVYSLYAFVYLIFNTFVVFGILNTILYIFAVINYFVIQFRGDSIKFWDLWAIDTASTVIKNYTFTLTPAMAIGLVFLFLFFLLCAYKCKNFNSKKGNSLYRIAVAFAEALLILTTFLEVIFPKLPAIDFWEIEKNYQKNGYFCTTLMFARHMKLNKPKNYSKSLISQIEQRVISTRPAGEATPDNIIVIMNESFSNLQALHSFETNQPVIPFWESLNTNVIKGDVYVPAFGGGTAKSEYEALTGNSSHFLPPGNVAYETVVKKEENGLCSVLKEQGFHTIAIHPYEGKNWNRDDVYSFMGFDKFITIDDFNGYDKLRDYISDLGNYQKIIECYESKSKDEKLFIFNVTMQNHGGYEITNGDIPLEIEAVGKDNDILNRYLSLVRKSDDALEYLLTYFSQQPENTMILFFGDHLPALPISTYEDFSETAYSELNSSMKLYRTPFIIWTNYVTELPQIRQISSNYLSSLLLYSANLNMTTYQKFLLTLSSQLPVIGPLGCYDSKGNYYPYDQLPEELQTLLYEYECMQYHNIVRK